ncbi:MAG TPA: hypothetical protein VNW53_13040 [Phenylobacterium sp.]|jgi:hypothetical protein|uniref:hypothetical protein n=1 Tax=Phenylobacterium sp. TaxID=1871053 RepID=UPI002C8FEADA|nr:hypothetical protein [Phenylobacterium sp.]HXA39919.1 hypothetical protein [Phenylobacterium sp.]
MRAQLPPLVTLARNGGSGHGRPMQTRGFVAALSALAFLLSACGLGERSDASKAIAGFLAAVQRDDLTAFEAGVDRAALRSDLRDQLAEVGKSRGMDVDGGASEFALDRMISPQAVRLAAAQTAPGWPAAPTPAQVTPRMKVRDLNHVCLEQAATKKCLLEFARRKGVWRLVGMPARSVAANALTGAP